MPHFATMAKRVVLAIFMLSFVFTVVMLAATIKEKLHLKEERKWLILQNDSLHILHLEAKQQLLMMEKRMDSIEHKLAGNFK